MPLSLHLGSMQIPLELISPFYVNFQVYLYSKVSLHYNANRGIPGKQSKQAGRFVCTISCQTGWDERISRQEPANATYECHRAFAMLRWKKGWTEMGLLSMLALVDNLPSHGSWPLPDLPVPPEQILIRCNSSHSRHQCPASSAAAGLCPTLHPAATRPLAQLLIPAHCPTPDPAHSPMLRPVLSSCSCVSGH